MTQTATANSITTGFVTRVANDVKELARLAKTSKAVGLEIIKDPNLAIMNVITDDRKVKSLGRIALEKPFPEVALALLNDLTVATIYDGNVTLAGLAVVNCKEAADYVKANRYSGVQVPGSGRGIEALGDLPGSLSIPCLSSPYTLIQLAENPSIIAGLALANELRS
jgi:hypothetical protein